MPTSISGFATFVPESRGDPIGVYGALAITGTPKELDEQLPRQLVEFVEAHLGLSSTLKSAKEQMEAAAKAAREAARNIRACPAAKRI